MAILFFLTTAALAAYVFVQRARLRALRAYAMAVEAQRDRAIESWKQDTAEWQALVERNDARVEALAHKIAGAPPE